MRFSAIFREARKNVTSGTGRPIILMAVVLAVVCGGLVFETRAIANVLDASRLFDQAGATTYVLGAPGRVDGNMCRSLTDSPEIIASGSLRKVDSLSLPSMPNTPLPAFEASAEFTSLFGLTDTGRPGVFLSNDAAVALGRGQGEAIATGLGSADVVGVFAFPEDGRQSALVISALLPVDLTERFDECWAKFRVGEATDKDILYRSLIAGSAISDSTLTQLNSSLGVTLDAEGMFGERPSRWTALVVSLLCLSIGFGNTWLRRLELSADRHARVSRSAQVVQVTLENAMSLALAGFVAIPVLIYAAREGIVNQDTPAVLYAGLVVLISGAGSTIVGSCLAVLAVREDHLFRYFKSH